nr:hypothetical protein [Allomuricauda sp.]
MNQFKISGRKQGNKKGCILHEAQTRNPPNVHRDALNPSRRVHP